MFQVHPAKPTEAVAPPLLESTGLGPGRSTQTRHNHARGHVWPMVTEVCRGTALSICGPFRVGLSARPFGPRPLQRLGLR